MRHLSGLCAARVSLLVAIAVSVAAMPALAQSDATTAGAEVWSRVPASMRSALERITPESLSGDLSFIASDLLEGRDTPSRGQEIAAYFIASQFRGAGLEPIGDDGYFQTANWEVNGRGADAFSGSMTSGGKTIALSYDRMSILTEDEVSVAGARLVRVASANPDAVEAMDAEALKGAVVLTDLANYQSVSQAARREAFMAMQALLPKLAKAGVVAVIGVDRSGPKGSGFGTGTLVNPESPQSRGRGFRMNPPLMWSHDPEVVALFDALGNGPTDGTVDLVLGPMRGEPVKLRNVVGLLRGSDETLRDEYVLVTAHYDHLGVGSPVDGDSIFNGANDDGSGTVSVIAIARALGALAPEDRPARSILFMTVFGEEKGLLGSQYYASHPIVPLEQTVGNINLEQIGRTDSSEGPQINRASLTGFAFSTLTDSFVEAGQAMGVDVYDHPANSESFFSRSDNVAFAIKGIPAHTLCVAYVYPDYHQRGDHWEKVNYVNMSHIDRMVGLGLYLLADAAQAPAWNAEHPRTRTFVKAWKTLHGEGEP